MTNSVWILAAVTAAASVLLAKRGARRIRPTFVVVSPKQAKVDPYPYVYVDEDSTARELHKAERECLETKFSPFDGGRPYVKAQFSSRDGWGSIAGFIKRTDLPSDLIVQPAPSEDPSRRIGKAELAEFLHNKGLDVTENADGTIAARKPVK